MENLSTPHLEQGRMLLVEKAMSVAAAFFSLADGSQQFQNHSFTMYLKNWDTVDPQSLKKTRLIFFCDTEWPQYPLEDKEH